MELLLFFTLLRGSVNASTVDEGNRITARARDALGASFVGSAKPLVD